MTLQLAFNTWIQRKAMSKMESEYGTNEKSLCLCIQALSIIKVSRLTGYLGVLLFAFQSVFHLKYIKIIFFYIFFKIIFDISVSK